MQTVRRLGPWQSLLLLIFSVIACFGLIKFVYWALNAPYFDIKVFSIAGLNYESESAIIEIVAPMKGKNIFKADLREYEAQLEKLDHIESARLYRDIPAKVKIEIVERELIGLLNNGVKLTLVDEKGIIRGAIRKGQIYDLPIISAVPQNDTQKLAVVNILRALKSLLPEAYQAVSEVTIEGDVITALIGENLTPILLGDANHHEMAQKLWVVMNKSETHLSQMQYADLRSPGKVFFKRKKQ